MTQIKTMGHLISCNGAIKHQNHRDSAVVLGNAIQAATGQVQRTAWFEYGFNS